MRKPSGCRSAPARPSTSFAEPRERAARQCSLRDYFSTTMRANAASAHCRTMPTSRQPPTAAALEEARSWLSISSSSALLARLRLFAAATAWPDSLMNNICRMRGQAAPKSHGQRFAAAPVIAAPPFRRPPRENSASPASHSPGDAAPGHSHFRAAQYKAGSFFRERARFLAFCRYLLILPARDISPRVKA